MGRSCTVHTGRSHSDDCNFYSMLLFKPRYDSDRRWINRSRNRKWGGGTARPDLGELFHQEVTMIVMFLIFGCLYVNIARLAGLAKCFPVRFEYYYNSFYNIYGYVDDFLIRWYVLKYWIGGFVPHAAFAYHPPVVWPEGKRSKV